MFAVYILLCSDGSFYTGLTGNLTTRVERHQAGRGASYTKTRLPVQLVFKLSGIKSRKRAREAEKHIKQLSRKSKRALADGDMGELFEVIGAVYGFQPKQSTQRRVNPTD